MFSIGYFYVPGEEVDALPPPPASGGGGGGGGGGGSSGGAPVYVPPEYATKLYVDQKIQEVYDYISEVSLAQPTPGGGGTGGGGSGDDPGTGSGTIVGYATVEQLASVTSTLQDNIGAVNFALGVHKTNTEITLGDYISRILRIEQGVPFVEDPPRIRNIELAVQNLQNNTGGGGGLIGD